MGEGYEVGGGGSTIHLKPRMDSLKKGEISSQQKADKVPWLSVRLSEKGSVLSINNISGKDTFLTSTNFGDASIQPKPSVQREESG